MLNSQGNLTKGKYSWCENRIKLCACVCLCVCSCLYVWERERWGIFEKITAEADDDTAEFFFFFLGLNNNICSYQILLFYWSAVLSWAVEGCLVMCGEPAAAWGQCDTVCGNTNAAAATVRFGENSLACGQVASVTLSVKVGRHGARLSHFLTLPAPPSYTLSLHSLPVWAVKLHRSGWHFQRQQASD